MAIYDTNAQRDTLNSNLFASKKKRRKQGKIKRRIERVYKANAVPEAVKGCVPYTQHSRCSIKGYVNRTQQLSSLLYSKLTQT